MQTRPTPTSTRTQQHRQDDDTGGPQEQPAIPIAARYALREASSTGHIRCRFPYLLERLGESVPGATLWLAQKRCRLVFLQKSSAALGGPEQRESHGMRVCRGRSHQNHEKKDAGVCQQSVSPGRFDICEHLVDPPANLLADNVARQRIAPARRSDRGAHHYPAGQSQAPMLDTARLRTQSSPLKSTGPAYMRQSNLTSYKEDCANERHL